MGHAASGDILYFMLAAATRIFWGIGYECETDKTCSYGDDVELFVAAVLKPDAGLSELGDGVVFDVNDIHIGPVELLEVILFQTWSLHAEEVRHLQWSQNIPFLGVADSISYMFGPEVVCFLVGFSIVQHVFVVTEPKAEAPVVPQLVIECVTFLGGVIEGILLVHGVQESTETLLAVLVKAVVPLLPEILFFRGEHPLLHGNCKVGCPLVHFHLTNFGSPFLGNLDSRGARAYHSSSLPFDIDAFFWPERRVVNDTLELFETFERRDVAFGCL